MSSMIRTRVRHRHGAVYIVVLMASLIVATLAMAALSSAQFYARGINRDTDFRRAQMTADAALEWAVANINADADWRTTHANNVDVAARQFNGTSIRYRLIDSDGDLADDLLDPCDLVVTSSSGDASFSWRATIEPCGPALNCLDYAFAGHDNFTVSGLSLFCTDGSIAADNSITVNNTGRMTADCYAGGTCTGDIYGSINTFSGTLEIPDESILDRYASIATSIDSALLPQVSGALEISGQLLSPAVNSISGVGNPLGIYVIDCGNNNIRIKDSRLNCTLILRNSGPGSLVSGSVYWDVPRANYPALLIDNNLELTMLNTPLKESSVGVNLNPAGTPYRGEVDTNTSTVYPSQIRGLIFSSQEIKVGSLFAKTQIFGTLVCGNKAEVTGALTVHYRDIYALDPPPGFCSYASVRIAAGSVSHVATPTD